MLRRRGESTRGEGKKNRGFYSAGAGSACQALRNSWSICPCLQPVCKIKKKKKRAEEQKGMDQAGGKQQIADASIGEGSL